MRAHARQMYRQTARGAGKRASARENPAERIARQIVRAVDLIHVLARKKFQAACGTAARLLRALEQKIHAAPNASALCQQRSAAQRGRVAVVAAQMRRAALLQRQRVIVGAQRNGRRCCIGLAVYAIKAGAAVMQLQRGMLC